MAEVSVSAVLIEQDDGTYRAYCPEVSVEATGGDSEAAFENLKAAVKRHISETGPGGLKMSSVKCMRFKVEV